jgi:hypothetical protein
VRVELVPCQDRQHQRAQHVALARRVATVYSSGQSSAPRSNTPAAARNSAKNTSWPFAVAAAPSSVP